MSKEIKVYYLSQDGEIIRQVQRGYELSEYEKNHNYKVVVMKSKISIV